MKIKNVSNVYMEIIDDLKKQLKKRKDLFFEELLQKPMTFVSDDNINIQILTDGIECFELLVKGFEEIIEEDILKMWFETAISFFDNYYEINQYKKPKRENKILLQLQEKMNDCYQQLHSIKK